MLAPSTLYLVHTTLFIAGLYVQDWHHDCRAVEALIYLSLLTGASTHTSTQTWPALDLPKPFALSPHSFPSSSDQGPNLRACSHTLFPFIFRRFRWGQVRSTDIIMTWKRVCMCVCASICLYACMPVVCCAKGVILRLRTRLLILLSNNFAILCYQTFNHARSRINCRNTCSPGEIERG